MKLIKFGGTSLQTPTLVNNAIEIIKKYDDKTLVVVSAIGRKGFPYSTQTLIESLKERKISNKEYDRFLLIGEIFSSVFFSNEIKNSGLKAYALSFKEMGLKCDNNYGDGNIISLDCKKINELFTEYQVLIIPGFGGLSNQDEPIIFGRGGSDLTLVLCAEMLKEKNITLFKDIDGVYPTIKYPLTKIRPYENLSYDECLTLCEIGYDVINQKALKEAKKNNITIEIENFNQNMNRTIISSKPSNKKVIGFNIVNNTFYLSTFFVEEVILEIDEILKKRNIFIKNYEQMGNYFIFNVIASQTLLVRQVILSTYFSDMLKN